MRKYSLYFEKLRLTVRCISVCKAIRSGHCGKTCRVGNNNSVRTAVLFGGLNRSKLKKPPCGRFCRPVYMPPAQADGKGQLYLFARPRMGSPLYRRLRQKKNKDRNRSGVRERYAAAHRLVERCAAAIAVIILSVFPSPAVPSA